MSIPTRVETESSQYEVVGPEPVLLGRLSVFFAARRVGDDRPLLIKSFRGFDAGDTSISSFYREIEALRRLHHPNILEIVDYSLGRGAESPPFLVIPWCKGGNLTKLRRQRDFVPLESAITILRQIASAIDFAHQNGVIHGDIKPQNVLLSADCRQAFLTDFGMAKYFEVSDRVISMAGAGEGTSAFLSPEQLNDNKQTPLSDIYSFGVLAFQLLTGEMPYDIAAPLYRQAHARVTGHVVDPRDANPTVTNTVRSALLTALAVKPTDRPNTASEFCDMLMGIRPAKKGAEPAVAKNRFVELWNELDPAGKGAVIVAVVAGAAGIVVAAVKALLGND